MGDEIMMRQVESVQCATYEEATKLQKAAIKKAKKDFGGRREKAWKVRIKYRKVGHFDVKTYQFAKEPPKPVETVQDGEKCDTPAA